MTPTREDFAELSPADFMDKVEAEAREYNAHIYQPEESDGRTDWATVAGLTLALALMAALVVWVWMLAN